MSKSRGNVVDPDELVKKYGVDTVRLYLCFMGEYRQGGPWNPTGILGIKRLLDRIWNYAGKENYAKNENIKLLLHQTIKKVGSDIESFGMNTAISQLMICLNAFEAEGAIPKSAYSDFLKLLAPFAPHLTEELWHELGNSESIHRAPWPS